jgi:hypothetical protein
MSMQHLELEQTPEGWTMDCWGVYLTSSRPIAGQVFTLGIVSMSSQGPEHVLEAYLRLMSQFPSHDATEHSIGFG